MLNNSFKPIPGYNDYLINENGDVFSTKRNRLLKTRKDKYGYSFIVLCKNNKSKFFRIHRLVAQTFIPNPENLQYVNHIDCDKSNNNVSNLEWCTASQNLKHAWDNGLRENARETTRQLGKNIGKLNAKYAQEARKKHLDENLKELFDEIFIRKSKTKNIAKKFNLTETYINLIKNKRTLKTAISEYQKSNLFDIWDKIL